MKVLELTRTSRNFSRMEWYRNLPLMKLVQEIVDKGDRLALEEFHNNRTLFRYSEGPPLRFSDYLNELRESTARELWLAPNVFEVADQAYDLTLDKFNNFPGKKESSFKAQDEIGGNMKRKGADCRLYLNVFLKRAACSFATNPPSSHIEEEARAAKMMQGLVRRHFYFSLLEALRQANPFWSRYNWMVQGDKICVWLPVSLAGRDRRRWLENNIDNPDPLREGERERIQSIIYKKLVREKFVGLGEDTEDSSGEEFLPSSNPDKTFGASLAETVAREKAMNINRQRRSIRALGKKRLKHLILRIFEAISCDEYKDGKAARDCGLSKSTFSRFAGSRWLEAKTAIPDLWRNTAEVLSTHPALKEVAISTGAWKQVQSAIQRGAPQSGGRASHV
jgi:hypothetical protein